PAPKQTNHPATSVASQGRTPGPAHHYPEQVRGDKMQPHAQHLVRDEVPQSEDRPPHPVGENRKCHPMPGVRSEQVVKAASAPRDQEVPIVVPEPEATSPNQKCCSGRELERDKTSQCRHARNVGALASSIESGRRLRLLRGNPARLLVAHRPAPRRPPCSGHPARVPGTRAQEERRMPRRIIGCTRRGWFVACEGLSVVGGRRLERLTSSASRT